MTNRDPLPGAIRPEGWAPWRAHRPPDPDHDEDDPTPIGDPDDDEGYDDEDDEDDDEEPLQVRKVGSDPSRIQL